MQKYKSKATNGFPSKLESALNDYLIIKERMGEIREIKRQQTVVLQDGPRSVRITWRVDFSYEEISSGQTVYAEAKGFESADYKLKLKMWRARPPATLEIYKGSHRAIKLVERIEVST